jgi:protein-tyrosine phosphatase
MYRVTRVLSVGPFASPERAETLLAAGVTHVLNVSDAASEIISSERGFKGVAWVPMSDGHRLPFRSAVTALDALHEMVSAADSHVYVHCVAGMVRSPTILWLYLVSLGVPWKDAREWIQARSPMASAGSSRMVDHEHRQLAKQHGLANFLPLSRPDAIVPFEIPTQGADAPRSG